MARIAATGGGTRFMTWQEEDANANRQGLTIAEMEEWVDPAWAAARPARPSRAPRSPEDAFAVRSADKTSLRSTGNPRPRNRVRPR